MKQFTVGKEIVSLLLCLTMLFLCVPGFALAENETALSLAQPTEVTVAVDTEVMCVFTPEKDGYYRFYSVSGVDPYATLYDSDMNELVFNDDAYEYDFALKNKLYAGETYYLEVGAYEDETVSVPVYVEESVGAVSAVLVTEPYSNEIVEGYEYETISVEGMEVEFTFADGTEAIWYADDDNTVADSEVDVYPGEKDGKFYVEVVCDDATLTVPYQVIPNPVKSISYKGEGFSFYEGTYGYLDSELDYYIYNYSFSEEDILVIEFTNGTSEEIPFIGGDFPYFEPTIEDNQSTTPWTLGENAIGVTYLGKETTVPVSILPCPYKSVTVNANPTTEVVFGDMNIGAINEDVYYFIPDDFTGLSFTFELTDGSTQTYTARDIDLEMNEIDGYMFDIEVAFCEKPGMVDMNLYYKGMKIPFQVKVVESPFASLEVLGSAEKLVYEDWYNPVLDGLSLKLTMKNGTSQTVELNKDTVEYDMEMGLVYRIAMGDNTVFGYVDSDENGDTYFTFYCKDIAAKYEGFRFVPQKDVAQVEVSDFSPKGEGMVLTVIYEEEPENDTLTLEKLCENNWGGGYRELMGKTENGILYYAIEEVYEEGTLIGYGMEVLGCSLFFEVGGQGMGDLNGDTKIDAKDALQVLKYAVGKAEFTIVQELNADVNEDSSINAKDALEILKYSVGKPSALDRFYAE